MRAIIQDTYGSADVLKLEEIERPEVGDEDVLVRVRAAGLDPGVWHVMTGLPYMIRIMGYGLRRPKHRVVGMDLAGTVAAVGRKVTRFRPGDEVFGACQGSFAEYGLAREKNLAPKPAGLSFEQAAAVYSSGVTALQALRDPGELKAGQSALVIGAAGGVGSFAVQIAKALGARVTGVCSTTKTELVRSLGAADVIDYTREELADGRRHWDLILDTAGNRPLSLLRRALAPAGTLVIVGGEGGGRWLGGMERVLKGYLLSPFVRHKLRFQVPKEGAHDLQDLQRLRELLEAGAVTPVIDRSYPLREAAEAIRYWEEGHARGKVVITL